MSDSESSEDHEDEPQQKKAKRKRPATEPAATADLSTKWNLNRYTNKQRTLVFCSRGVSHRDRHLLQDLRDMLPHSKKEVKFDAKGKLALINEVCELKSCNNCIFLEAKKRQDLYLWMSKTPHGPSVRFLLQNVHTMSEVKLTGNCLKGSRPLLSFSDSFESAPHWQLIKEMLTQVFGSPMGHPHVKPFVDHVLSFMILDNRIWFRNYQISFSQPVDGKGPGDMLLVEVGPRFVLNPIKIFAGSFGGAMLWENSAYVSPNISRKELLKRKSVKYSGKVASKTERKQYEAENRLPQDELADTFA
jgi:ribosome biogenesis protein BRX1